MKHVTDSAFTNVSGLIFGESARVSFCFWIFDFIYLLLSSYRCFILRLETVIPLLKLLNFVITTLELEGS